MFTYFIQSEHIGKLTYIFYTELVNALFVYVRFAAAG